MKSYKLKKLVIKPTMACTANCKTCQLRRDLHKSLINQRKLSFEQWLKIFQDASQLGVERLDISGGEPTLYKNLIDLIKAGKSYGWYINLNTNGSLINEKYARKLIDAGLDSVSISIYSANPEIHDQMRNCEGLWSKATQAVRTFARLREQLSSNLQIATQCLICRENYSTLADLMKLDYELGSDRIALTYLEGDFEKQYLLKENEINDFKYNVIPQAKKFCETLDTEVKNKAIEVIESVFSEKINSISNFAGGLYRPEEKNPEPCKRPQEFTILLANGDVHPCNMVEYSHEPVMGNLFEQSLPEIWYSEKWNNFRENLFDYCRLCPINLYMTVPLRPKYSQRTSSCKSQVCPEIKKIPQEMNIQQKTISPSFWMFQTIEKKHYEKKLLEHGYPDLKSTQYWPYEKLTAFQNARLHSMIEYAYMNIPGYRRKFNDSGIKPGDINTIDVLCKLPVTTRHELQDNGDFVNQNLVSGTLYTGGSTGTSLKYYESELSMLIRNESHLRGWQWGGFEYDMRYCILKSAQKIQQHGDCLHLIGDLTEENLRENLAAVQGFRPQHLKGYVGSLYIFARYCIDNSIRIEGLKSVIPSSENLYDYQRQAMEQAFGCKVFEEYCCNDGGACAWECESREGLHYVMERAIIEEVNGRMIVTDLWNLAMPFIRYENGDSVQFLDKKCSCGRQLPLIKVKGRTNDIIITPKGVITPTFLMHHGIGLVGVDKQKPNFRSGFRAVQYIQKPGNILEVNIVNNSWCTSQDIDNFKKDLDEFMGGLRININFVNEIPKTKKGKTSFIINEDKDLLAKLQNESFEEPNKESINIISENNQEEKKKCINTNCGDPKVSVLLCVYNGQKYIGRALESIGKQSFQDFEIVVVDDASTDLTPEVLKKYKDSRTFIHRNAENLGLTKSLNIGLSHCRGKYIARMDADDISLPERFEKQVKFLDENPDCAAVGSWCKRIDEKEEVVNKWRHPADYEGIKERLVTQNSIFHGTAMFRKESVFKIGGYNEKYKYSQDYDLWLRLSETAKICNINEYLYLSRSDSESISNINRQQQNRYAEMARREAFIRRSDTDSFSLAMRYFLEARDYFDKDCFEAAVESINKYKSVVDYTRLDRKVNPGKGVIDVSVVIVTYNRKDELIKCIETVSCQNTDNYEIIVVDNGGCDYESIKQYVNQYIKCPINFNLSEGRNIGVHFANGKIVAFLDDDALVERNYIQSIKSAFDIYNIFGLRGKTLPKNPPVDCIGSNIYDLGNNPFPSYCNQEGNSAWLRDIYLSMEGMDPLLFGHEGSDLTYRIIKKYNEPNKIIYWPETIIYHNYPTQEKSKSKYVIHQRSSNYIKYKHNANIFANRKEIEKFQICKKQDEIKTIPVINDKIVLTQSGLKVSIVIACHNCEKYLPKCVESIQNQTMKDWELFLVDDSSSDNTKDIIDKFSQMDRRIRPYFFDDNTGPYVRRNFAIERAKSDFIVIQDSDDIMHPEKLGKLYNEITKNERLGIVGSFYLMALDEFKDIRFCDKIELPVTHSEIMENYNSQVYVCWHGSAVIRKNLFETVGLYDEHPYGSDKFWLAKAAEYARYTNRIEFKNIPEYLTYKIEHSSSQQGQLPNLDPRSRRAKFQTYWHYKLMKIREKVLENPGTNVCSELRNCKCNDYIAKYGHLFELWEKEKLDEDSISIYTVRAVDRFNEDNYVSCIITLDSVEKICPVIAKKMRHYNLLRAMAYYAIDRKERSLEYLDLEIKTHNSPAASQFLNDGFGEQHIENIHVWCENNSDKYDLRVIDTGRPTTDQPLVSVIIPAYNAAEYIAEAIKSVLAQDYKNYELLIINDGSTDNTEKIILGFRDDRIHYMSQANHGLAATHNIAIKKSQGEFIIKLDCDDLMTPDFISKHIKHFMNHPDADLVYCDDYLIDENAKPIRIIERQEYSDRNILIRDLFRNGFPVIPFRTCIKRSVFDRIGYFDEKLTVAEDYDMMRRFVMHGLKAYHLKGALYLRRITKDSLSRKSAEHKAKSHFDVVKRYADTFSHDELFPDMNWQSIALSKRRLCSKYLAAETFLAIGCDYIKSNSSPVYAKEAFELAGNELDDCLKIDPNNKQVKKLIQTCELHKQSINKQVLQYV
jgi:glycosyltransferase involved in cell wall biosynthesis/phenylacetate-coenzyme A ligase PaaK-like adenylate-forming protein/MoaA/NifB/PqqE/SkfB family radical SAM enzyme